MTQTGLWRQRWYNNRLDPKSYNHWLYLSTLGCEWTVSSLTKTGVVLVGLPQVRCPGRSASGQHLRCQRSGGARSRVQLPLDQLRFLSAVTVWQHRYCNCKARPGSGSVHRSLDRSSVVQLSPVFFKNAIKALSVRPWMWNYFCWDPSGIWLRRTSIDRRVSVCAHIIWKLAAP